MRQILQIKKEQNNYWGKFFTIYGLVKKDLLIHLLELMLNPKHKSKNAILLLDVFNKWINKVLFIKFWYII